MPNPYFIASQVHHSLLLLLLLPIWAPPALPQLKTAQFSTRPRGQHISMTQKPRDRDRSAVSLLWIYIRIYFRPHTQLKISHFKQTGSSSTEWYVTCSGGVMWTGELGIFFFSHK